MTETPDEQRPRPTPRPRPTAGPRPSPRPRVAGSRKAADKPKPAAEKTAAEKTAATKTAAKASARPTATATRTARPAAAVPQPRRRGRAVVALVLGALCLVAAAAFAFLLGQRLNPGYVNDSIFSAARESVQALYAYDYRDSEKSIEDKLAVLTGDLRQQYEEDLEQGGIIDTYEQVSATTRYEVLDVGLQQINEAQDTATVVVFGQYVVESVNSGDQEAPEGSECQVTPEGAQSCTQTVQVRMLQLDGEWKISELVVLTTS